MGGRDAALSDEQLDYIVARYGEYCRFAADHPAYGVLLHFGNWANDVDSGDRMVAPWAMHTHVSPETVATRLEESMEILLDAGYEGYWGVEHHSGVNEYAEVQWQVAEVRRALAHRRAAARPADSGNPMINDGGT